MRLAAAVPSAITLAGALAALLAIVWAPMHPAWACNAIIVAALCDMVDGRVARLLGAQSALGAQLDSLVDVIAFGVAPALVAFQFRLHELGGLADAGALAAVPVGLAPAFAFVAGSALRLARFNTRPATPYFVGVPTPAAALLVVTPIMCWHELGWRPTGAPWFYAALLPAVAALMVAPLRFPSFKHFRSRVARALYFGAMAGGVTMLVVGLPGGTVLLGFLVLYLLSALAAPGGRYDADAK